MTIRIKITDYDKFYEKVYGNNNNRIFNSSLIFPYIEDLEENDSPSENDDRDIDILGLLTDDYNIKLNIDDISEFVNMVENDNSITCDLTEDKESNKFIEHNLSQKKEKEKYTESYIISNLDIDYKFLSHMTLSILPHYLFEMYSDKFNWNRISFLDLPIGFIERNKELLDWEILSINIDEMYYEKFYDYLIIPNLIEMNMSQDIMRDWKIDNLLN